MIHFLCICGEPFDVPAELAGDSMQCPVCLRLIDVPRLSDVDAYADDGTLRMADAEKVQTGLADKLRAFGGRQDMRPTMEDFLLAGTGGPSNAATARPTPRYDPVTGELMLPVGMQGDDDIAAAPPAYEPGTPVLGYARSEPLVPLAGPAPEVGWWSVPWRLITGMSIVAIAVIYALHVVIVLGLQTPGFNVFFALPAFFIALTIVAHYANTMEDFGPGDKDKVPVLFRTASFSEDISSPLLLVLAAALVAFGPLMLLGMFTPRHFFIFHAWTLYAALAWALMIFPVAALTTVCGGVIVNLTPRRMTSVVIAAPVKYVMATGAFWGAAGAYLFALGSMTFPNFANVSNPATTSTAATFLPFFEATAVTVGYFAVAVFLMHVAAVWLGLIHRKHHRAFDWTLQRHERVHRDDTMSRLMKSRSTPTAPPPPPHSGFEVKF